MKQSISIKLISALLLIFSISLAGAAYLNFTKFQQTYSKLSSEQFDDVARQLKISLEASIGGALSLEALQSTQFAIDQLVRQYQNRFSVLILDKNANILFATDNAHLTQTEIAPLASRIRSSTTNPDGARGSQHDLSLDNFYLTTLPIENRIGQVSGYVLLEHDRSAAVQTINQVWSLLWRGVLVFGLPFLIIIALAIYFAVRPTESKLHLDEQAFSSLIKDPETAHSPHQHSSYLTGYEDAYAIRRELDTIEDQLQSLAKGSRS